MLSLWEAGDPGARWHSSGWEERSGCSSGSELEKGEQGLPTGSARQLESSSHQLCKTDLKLKSLGAVVNRLAVYCICIHSLKIYM